MKIVRNLLIVILILGTIRLIIPFAALAGVNYVLKYKIEDYTGHVQDLKLNVLRGAVAFEDLHIEKKDKPNALMVDVATIKVNLSWQDFLNKKAQADVQINNLDVVLTELPKKKPPQRGELTFAQIRKKLAESKWASELNKFEIRNASVKFKVPEAKTPLSVSHIDADIYNLHFSPAKDWQLADFALHGFLQGQGEINLNGKVQPLAQPPMVDLNFSMVDFDLKSLNGLLLKLLPLDITRGKLSAYVEAASEKDFSNGYAKIFFDDIDVIANQQKFKSGRHVLIEFGTALGNWVLKNAREKSLAVRVPFKIKYANTDVKTTEALWSTFENKRDELDRKLENSVSFSQNREERSMF
ncbi:hypothetical protein CIK05_05020 [Bdellovibrio sp. qaytius]|nr:hypothetical protein CIK05_05020 [Bdellovibrio sp. qaytius]